MPRHPLSQRIADVLDLQPESHAIEYDGQWISWGQVGDVARRIASLTAGHPRVGMLLRNRPGHVAAFSGVLLGGGTVVVINPSRGDERTKADIAALAAAAGHRRTRRPGDAGPARDRDGGDFGSLDGAGEPARHADRRRGRARRRGADADQRNDRPAQANRPQLRHAGAQRDGSRPRPCAGTHASCDAAWRSSTRRWCTSAVCSACCNASRRPDPLCCWNDSSSSAWAEAVRKHRPRAVSLVPAALRTVLHSDLTRADLESIRAVTCGTAPLSADDADAFTREVRHTGPHLLCRNGIRWRRGRMDSSPTTKGTGKPSAAASAGPTRARSSGWSTTTARRSGRTGSACSRSSRDSWGHRRSGCAPRIWHASTRTASSG